MDENKTRIVNPSREGKVTVKERELQIPAELKIIGVQNDNLVENVYFEIPKTFDEVNDLSTFELRVNWLNANGDTDSDAVEIVSTEGETIVFKWNPTEFLTKYEGTVKISIFAIHEDGRKWNSAIAELTVLKGIVLSDEIVKKFPNVIEDLLKRVSYLENHNAQMQKTKVYDATIEMIADESLKIGDKVKTYGYESINDSGEAEFIIGELNTSKLQIALKNGLYATLIYNGFVNVKQMGCKTNNRKFDNGKKINEIMEKENLLFFPAGEYFIDTTIKIVKDNVFFKGELSIGDYIDSIGTIFVSSNPNIVPLHVGKGVLYKATNHNDTNCFHLENIQFKALVSGLGTAIYVNGLQHKFKNVQINHYENAMYFDYCYGIDIDGCVISECLKGIYGYAFQTTTYIRNTNIHYNSSVDAKKTITNQLLKTSRIKYAESSFIDFDSGQLCADNCTFEYANSAFVIGFRSTLNITNSNIEYVTDNVLKHIVPKPYSCVNIEKCLISNPSKLKNCYYCDVPQHALIYIDNINPYVDLNVKLPIITRSNYNSLIISIKHCGQPYILLSDLMSDYEGYDTSYFNNNVLVINKRIDNMKGKTKIEFPWLPPLKFEYARNQQFIGYIVNNDKQPVPLMLNLTNRNIEYFNVNSGGLTTYIEINPLTQTIYLQAKLDLPFDLLNSYD